MTEPSTAVAVRKVLGAVTCIVLLAYLAACSVGSGSNDVSLSQPQLRAVAQ